MNLVLVSHHICSNGDVGLINDGTPYIYWDYEWYPICGHYFWDGNVGASLICSKFGYESGVVLRKSGETYSYDSFKIGKCNTNDDFKNCKGGCNDYRVGDYCGNENIKDVANGRPGNRCDKDYGPKIAIKCLNNTNRDSKSCDGGM